MFFILSVISNNMFSLCHDDLFCIHGCSAVTVVQVIVDLLAIFTCHGGLFNILMTYVNLVACDNCTLQCLVASILWITSNYCCCCLGGTPSGALASYSSGGGYSSSLSLSQGGGTVLLFIDSVCPSLSLLSAAALS